MSEPSQSAPASRDGDASFGAMVMALATPCALLDRSGRVEMANAAWESHQKRLAPIGGNLVDAFATVGGGEPAARGLRDLIAGDGSQFACDLCVDEANDVWIRLFASRDPGGATLVLLVDAVDRTSIRSRNDSERRLQLIVESAMDGIVTIDESQRIVMFNAAAERIFGVAASEALGGTLTRFLPHRHRASHASHVQAFGKTGVSSRSMGNLGTISGVHADGTEFPIEASISQAVVGSHRYYTVILRDVSERRRLESQLLQAQKMEGVGRLAGGIAHDFNNLLMAIFNYLTLASRRLGPEHPVSASIAHAQRAAERAADLTRQLLTFARKQTVAHRVVCPRDVAAGLLSMLRRLIGEGVTLRVALDESTGNVRADAAQLEQVLVNLTINARDAMPAGGTLTIETRNETLDESYCRNRLGAAPGEHVLIAVSDTGTGMTPEVLARIFEPFFTTKPVGKGTGLGLATCQGIVKQSGGHIDVRSEPERGTSIRVFLPRVRSEVSQSVDASTTKAPPGGTETILLVEDSALVRELVSEELRDAGYAVLSAASGPEALRLMEIDGRPIDLLLTDVVMPEMSGVRLAELVLATQSPAVLYMSGHAEESLSQYGLDPALVAFIAKPFAGDTLLHRIRALLRNAPPA
ncbi:MAG: ATP-binding protein [Planctomycetota bacterium]